MKRSETLGIHPLDTIGISATFFILSYIDPKIMLSYTDLSLFFIYWTITALVLNGIGIAVRKYINKDIT